MIKGTMYDRTSMCAACFDNPTREQSIYCSDLCEIRAKQEEAATKSVADRFALAPLGEADAFMMGNEPPPDVSDETMAAKALAIATTRKRKMAVPQGKTVGWGHWTTPNDENDPYLDFVRELGPIVLDPCSNPTDKVQAQYRIFYEPAWKREIDDGTFAPLPVSDSYRNDPTTIHANTLDINWCSALRLEGVKPGGVIFYNPIYGPFLNTGPGRIGPGIKKMIDEGMRCLNYGFHLVALLPAKTDTNWWQKTGRDNRAGHFWDSRLAFGNPAPDHKGADSPGGANYTAYFGPEPARFISIFERRGVPVAPIVRL